MYTECPTCHTAFRVHPPQLAMAGGKVRCGECMAVFDAREYLREDLGESPAARPLEKPAATAVSAAPAPAQSNSSLPARRSGAETFRKEHRRAAKAPETAASPSMAALELELRKPPGRSSNGIWLAVSLLLLASLAGQSAYYYRVQLAATPALRPALEKMCTFAGCTIAPLRNPGAFELTGRSVQTHPTYSGALLIDATFVNRSDSALPYPDLEIVFTDTEGHAVAGRRFAPAEYLGDQPQQVLAAGAEAHAILEIMDPGDQAVGYEFHFF